MSYQSAKIFMIQHVIRTLKEKADTHKDIDYRPILNQYFNELSFLIDMESDDKNTKELHRLRDIAEDVETETLQQLIKQERITKKDLSDYRKVMELTQSFREMSFIEKLNRFSKLIILRFKARKDSRKSVNQSSFEQQRYTDRKELRHNFKKVQHIIRIVNRQVTLRLQEEQNSTNVLEVSLIINQYYALSRTLRQHHNRKRQREENKFMYELNTQQQYDAKLDALYTQRQILDDLISRNKVTNEIATQLRENINYNEIVLAKELNH